MREEKGRHEGKGLQKENGAKLTNAVRFRLFKFPQMDFEMAIWEMTSLLIAPKKVFRSIYYHVTTHLSISHRARTSNR